MRYNSFVMSCKTDIIKYNIMQVIPIYITMQGLVKEVTLQNHRNNGHFAWKSLGGIINLLRSDAYQSYKTLQVH